MSTTPDPEATAPSEWQAVWAPQYGAYYFYNTETKVTTWTNPLQPEEKSSSVSDDRTPSADEGNPDAGKADEDATSTGLTYSASSHYAALQAAAVAQGIDPGLAHLDPSLGGSLQGTSNVPGGT